VIMRMKTSHDARSIQGGAGPLCHDRCRLQ
jgi:hypothetical protein